MAKLTGGKGSWSGASATKGGTAGKTFGGAKTGKLGLPSMKTGHTKGTMPGNMMGHSASKVPFSNTGNHPPGGKLTEISVTPATSSQAKNPGALKMQGKSFSKLENSTPYSAKKVMSTDSWTGGSGLPGGAGAKTRGKA